MPYSISYGFLFNGKKFVIYKFQEMASSQILDEYYRIPKPPPLPSRNYGSHRNYMRNLGDCVNLYEKRKDAWDKIFIEGYGADVRVVTGKDDANVATRDDHVILAHSCILVCIFKLPL
jgi:hypothetical protein